MIADDVDPDDVDPWAHYMKCDAVALVELLAELLRCDETQVQREVQRLVRRCG